MMLNCFIIDDEPVARMLLKEYIEETDFLTLAGTAENALKAIGLINKSEVDLIFLDINMPKMNGLEFLRSVSDLPMVIMTTAYAQYALDGFEMSVIDYLVKPFSLERFLKASQKALNMNILKQKAAEIEGQRSDYFFVKCEGKIEKVIYDELIYIQSMSNYLMLYTLNDRLIVYLTMKGIYQQLPAEKFLQVHKSFIINISFVQTIEGSVLYLGSAKVSVGFNYQDDVKQRLLKDRFITR